MKSLELCVGLALLSLAATPALAMSTTHEATAASNHVLWTVLIPEVPHDRLLFEDGVGEFTKAADMWTVEGNLVDATDPGTVVYRMFLSFTDITDVPPPGSPKEVPAGADTSDWLYAQTVEGGLFDPMTDALVFGMERHGPAAQLGFGASAKNLDYGLASWLQFSDANGVPFAEHGDININVNPVPEPSAALVFGLGAAIVSGATRRRNR